MLKIPLYLFETTYVDAEVYCHEGRITEEQFDFFSYIWRNTAFRFSNVAEQFEDTVNKDEIIEFYKTCDDHIFNGEYIIPDNILKIFKIKLIQLGY